MADLSAADLLAPQGPITPTLFPSEDAHRLETRLDAYLATAYADGRVVAIATADADNRNPAARALALYLAFTDVYIRMSAEPLSVNVQEKGSHGYSTAQLANIKAIADGYLADLEAMIPAAATDAVPLSTTSVPNTFVW